MFERNLVVKNKTGLHARPAASLASLCGKFKSEIRIYTEGTEINPKSVLSIMAGGVYAGTPIRLTVEGEDEEEALKALVNAIESMIIPPRR